MDDRGGCGRRVAAVAAVVSYANALVRAHGETGSTARLIPLTVDGLIYTSSMVMLDSVRRKVPVPVLARWLFGPGIAATLAANVACGAGPGRAVPAGWFSHSAAFLGGGPISGRLRPTTDQQLGKDVAD
jgi:hypothetical protein